MKIKRKVALWTAISLIVLFHTVSLAKDAEEYSYWIEAESAQSVNWISTGGGTIQTKEACSNKKYLNLFYPSNGSVEYYAEYKVNIAKEGVYALDIASTPLAEGWASPIDISVNGGEKSRLKGDKFELLPNETTMAWYHANVLNFKKGINTIRFSVMKPRDSDGNVCCFFDCFALKESEFGMYLISSEAPMQAFQQCDEIKFTVEANGVAPQREETVYEVLDYDGKMVEAGKVAFEQGQSTASIRLNQKKNGAYQLLVSLGNQSLLKQFIVVTNLSERKEITDSPFAVDALPYGMRNDINAQLTDDYCDLIALSGVKWIRDRVYFDPFVTKAGGEYQFTMPHTKVTGDLLKERGVNVSMAMDLLPAMLRANDYGDVLPTNLFEVYQFWKDLAEKYDGAVKCWEIGNEVDLGGGGSNRDGADTYASLFKAAALGIMDSKTENEVFVSPMGAAARPGNKIQFAELLYENEIYQFTNIVNYHNHISVSQPYKNYYKAPTNSVGGHLPLQEEFQTGNVTNWDGEAGISLDIPKTRDYTANEQMVQAKYIITSFIEDIAAGTDKRFFFDGLNFQEGGKAWGMTSRGNKTPSAYAAWASLSGLTYVMGEGRYLNKVENLPENIAAHAFADGEDTVLAFWSTSEGKEKIQVTFQTGYQEAVCYDMFGNPQNMTSNNGSYSFSVDGCPMFLKVKGSINTGIISNQSVPIHHPMGDTQKSASDAQRVICLQQYDKLQRNGARLNGYQLTEDVNTVKVAVYNFNDHEVSGNVVGQSQNGWDIRPLTQPVTIAPMSMQEVTFDIAPDGFKGQEDRISFYADLDCGASSKSVIWANSRKIVNATPLIKDGKTNIEVKLENRLDIDKTVEKIILTVDGKQVEYNEPVVIAAKSAQQIDIPVEIDTSTNQIDMNADVYFTGGEHFNFKQNIPFMMAYKKIDLTQKPSLILPDDGAVISNMYYGNEDLSAKVWIAADDTNFYMTVIAVDNIHSAASDAVSNIWNDDGVQFSLGQGLPNESMPYYEMGMSLNQKLGAKMYCWNDSFGNGKAGIFQDAQCKITRNDKEHTTTYELALPWTSIAPISIEDNLMAFSMLINENDGMGRSGYIEWGSGIGSTKDPGEFRTVLFMK